MNSMRPVWLMFIGYAVTLEITCPQGYVMSDVCSAYPHMTMVLTTGEIKKPCGRRMSQDFVGDAPMNITYPYLHRNGKYVLVIVSPDKMIDGFKTMYPALHWMIRNVPGSSIIGNIKKLTPFEYFAYISPATTPGAGVYRLHYLLYKQAYPLNFSQPNNWEYIFYLNIFQKRHQLNGPVAAYEVILKATTVPTAQPNKVTTAAAVKVTTAAAVKVTTAAAVKVTTAAAVKVTTAAAVKVTTAAAVKATP